MTPIYNIIYVYVIVYFAKEKLPVCSVFTYMMKRVGIYTHARPIKAISR